MPVVVRRRVDDDLPALVEVLAAQQAGTGYPLRWPLPFPVVDFIRRSAELDAWTAEIDGRPVGHVCIQSVSAPGSDGDPLLLAWATGHRVGVDRLDRLAVVSALFLDPSVRGRGLGDRLLTTAVDAIGRLGRLPCLDVMDSHRRAAELYRRRGWREVCRVRRDWIPDDRDDLVIGMVLDAGPAPVP